mgnify:CR=1 FL=1
MRCVALLLILTLVLTSQAFAVARGQAAVAGEMVLCIGHLTVTVEVDADGNPLETRPACEQCLAAALTALTAQDVGPAAPRTLTQATWADPNAPQGLTYAQSQSARGPPQIS